MDQKWSHLQQLRNLARKSRHISKEAALNYLISNYFILLKENHFLAYKIYFITCTVLITF